MKCKLSILTSGGLISHKRSFTRQVHAQLGKNCGLPPLNVALGLVFAQALRL